jgi:hypothetical protein
VTGSAAGQQSHHSHSKISTDGDIVLRFTTGGGDGPNGVLARGFALSGINFDEAEDWLRSFDFAAVALHEIGQVLGPGHSSVQNSTMNPWCGGTYFELHPHDAHGIHSKYGWRERMWKMISGADSSIRSILAFQTCFSSSTRMGMYGSIWILLLQVGKKSAIRRARCK